MLPFIDAEATGAVPHARRHTHPSDVLDEGGAPDDMRFGTAEAAAARGVPGHLGDAR